MAKGNTKVAQGSVRRERPLHVSAGRVTAQGLHSMAELGCDTSWVRQGTGETEKELCAAPWAFQMCHA